ncbi:MAG TPA: hypothetical protein VEY11_04925 [Pyrinomonadaceae bacterium]|nr:hypothetical protein [Pyrinomonadaceae bacterium]
MKTRSLEVGITLMLLSGVVILICLLLPSMNSHVSFEEAMMVLIPTAGLFLLASLLTCVSAIKGRKSAS